MNSLLIGIGNTLRQDDGAGHAVVEQFVGRNDCTTLLTHQLFPEHADLLARVGRVVFVDACINAIEMELQKTAVRLASSVFGHVCDAEWLLALSEQIHARAPQAFRLGIPASDFGFGENFSSETRVAIQQAIVLLNDWLETNAE